MPKRERFYACNSRPGPHEPSPFSRRPAMGGTLAFMRLNAAQERGRQGCSSHMGGAVESPRVGGRGGREIELAGGVGDGGERGPGGKVGGSVNAKDAIGASTEAKGEGAVCPARFRQGEKQPRVKALPDCVLPFDGDGVRPELRAQFVAGLGGREVI